MGQPKALASVAITTSPGIASSSRGGRGTLWLGRVSPISAGFGLSMSIAGEDPYETSLSDLQGTRCTPPDSFTEIQSSF